MLVIRKIKMSHRNTETGFAHLLALLLIISAGVGGAGYYVYKQNQKTAKPLNSETVSADTTLTASLPSDLLTVDKVKELASVQKPTASVLGVQLENENGTLIFKVKLSDGTILAFNAKTGVAAKILGETELEGQITLPAGVTPAIDFAKARSIAMGQRADAIVQRIELELEENTLVYSVRFTDGGRVDVNASDGSIVKVKAGNKIEDKKSSNSNSSSSTDSHKSNSSGSSSNDSTENNNSIVPETETHDLTITDDSSHGGSSGSSGSSGHGSGH
jgi:uncharacterized membrane protein YkoI